MKKVMFVGPVGVGKTTLTQRLHGLSLDYQKTQTIQFHDSIIDTPGEFLQYRKFYNALSVTAMETDVIGLLCAADSRQQFFPEGFGALFSKEVIGIITKMDQVASASEAEFARGQLVGAGASRIFEISSVEDWGLEPLKRYLEGEE